MSEEKEIIIDGVDVSECEHYYQNPVNKILYNGCAIYEQTNELGYQQDTLCEQNPTCYFKQFKRLQQENEELKTYIKKMDKPEIKTIDSEIALKNIELQQENEELKNTPRLELDTSYIRKKELENIKYKQALEEIRTLQSRALDAEKTTSQQCFDNLYKVIDIVNEVLNDRD